MSQVAAWFFEEQVSAHPDQYRVYKGPDNPGVEYRFCAECGTTLYWRFEFLEQFSNSPVYGIAVGCFTDPEFPPPDIEIHTGNRHDWYPSVPGADQFHALPPGDRLVPAPGDPATWRSEPRKVADGRGFGEVVESPDETLEGFQFDTEILEISDSGLRLTCPRFVGEGVLDLWITLTKVNQKFHLNGQIKWVAERDEDFEMGVEIIDNPLTSAGLWKRALQLHYASAMPVS